jgi:hypothetical protein
MIAIGAPSGTSAVRAGAQTSIMHMKIATSAPVHTSDMRVGALIAIFGGRGAAGGWRGSPGWVGRGPVVNVCGGRGSPEQLTFHRRTAQELVGAAND